MALAAVYAGLYTASGVPLFMAVRGAAAAVLPGALLGLVSLGLAGRGAWPLEGRWRLFVRVVPVLLAPAASARRGSGKSTGRTS